MLFLAVTLGFFVENQREHYVENQREKKYIQSFYEDLTADEYDLQSNINFLAIRIQLLKEYHLK
jgi:deoxyadenosine/deoxycytidine kinase